MIELRKRANEREIYRYIDREKERERKREKEGKKGRERERVCMSWPMSIDLYI